MPAARRFPLQLIGAFFALYVIWGSTYLVIRIGIESWPPLMMAGVRFLIAGSLMYGFMRWRGAPAPTAVQWRSAAMIGFLLLACGNGGVTLAEHSGVASGVAALAVATVPLFTLLFGYFWGNRNILADAMPGDLFAESYAFLPGELLRVSVVSEEPSRLMLVDSRRMLEICSSACRFHTRLVQNVLAESARKNLALTRKLSHMSKRTTREKLLSYLSGQSLAAGSETFEIPFNRQQLADYLCVDRSAMSNELCKMRDEGMLSFDKSSFHLKSEIEI